MIGYFLKPLWTWRKQGRSAAPWLALGPQDRLTMHELYEGCIVFGSSGSGKTSGPGDAIARYVLSQGCGVLWLTAKPDEYERAVRLCRQTGRENDVVRFAPGEPHTFNFLQHELGSLGGGVNAAAQLLSDLLDLSSRTAGGQGSDPFWPMAAARLLRMALVICSEARNPCTVEHLYHFLTSLPSRETLHDAAWRESFAAKSIGLAADRQPHTTDFDLAAAYFLEEWPNLSEKTASSIHSQAMNVIDRFMSGGLARLIASERSTITPHDLEQGKVIVLDVPYLRYREPGQMVQIVWKLSAIRSLLRRNVAESPRPVALLMDEAQLFVVPRVDSATQAVARASRLVNVALTQNVPLLISALGGPGAEKEAHSWIANFATKLFCANTCKETNELASDLCGRSRHFFFGGSSGPQEPYDPIGDLFGQSPKCSASFNQQWFPDVPPEVFVSQLRRGGPAADYTVDAVAARAGAFSNGKPFLLASFRQELQS